MTRAPSPLVRHGAAVAAALGLVAAAGPQAAHAAPAATVTGPTARHWSTCPASPAP
ncbi:hypothetical protein AB5J72_27335 [Streptomyces sp. CG1]|uniref:hypothetical protein n=1 Tax=Streptomyces sp. CG1 TaxID=1287523 RepID=UPI0034E26597